MTNKTGDMLTRWTNGMYRSTPHRVRQAPSRDRVSVPFFFEPNIDTKVRPLKVCCEAQGIPPQFEAITYGEHFLKKATGNFKL